MNRRNFMKAGTVALGSAGLRREIAEAAESVPPAPAVRYAFSMNRNWLSGGKVDHGSTRSNFDDSKFQRVTLPHTNRLLPWHSFDEKEFQFLSIYRRHFRMPNTLRDRRIFVDFAGVMTAAIVTINGEKLDEYRGGYTPFSFELTRHIKWDEDNVIYVGRFRDTPAAAQRQGVTRQKDQTSSACPW